VEYLSNYFCTDLDQGWYRRHVVVAKINLEGMTMFRDALKQTGLTAVAAAAGAIVLALIVNGISAVTPAAPAVLMVVVTFVLLAIYFAPAIISSDRKHPNKTAIFVLNFFLGWTFIGWIAALIWACTNSQPTGVYVSGTPVAPVAVTAPALVRQ
jgi:RsiW-degrading membrane proteinase PrsW (M82 family)